jgi:hypothetical protein
MSEAANPDAHPLNAPGDFYVINFTCIACQAPEQEAPDLMSHQAGPNAWDYHCYFKRQPQTPEEIERSIMAVAVACCRTVRYGGDDPRIIERLSALRSLDACDNPGPARP